MKVGVVGPIWLDIPPKGYGGTEEVVFNLVNGLAEKGHDVTLFGPGTAKVKSKLFPTVPHPLRSDKVPWEDIGYSLYHITEAFDRAPDFDILHVHLNKEQDFLALPLAAKSKTPVVFTFHFMLPNGSFNPGRNKVLYKYKSLPFTTISDSQRARLPFNFIKTVYNSLDINYFPFNAKPQDKFVWLGKINSRKGTREAILAAKKAGVKLMVMGVVEKGVPEMLEYFEKEVMPLMDGEQILWLGEVGLGEKARHLSEAKGFLNPIQWEEPFGLVMIESQAVGTPVISFNRGAAPELIIDGKTGFLVEDIDQMVSKIKDIDQISRMDCRKNVENNFSIAKMVEGYEDAYKTTIKNWDKYISR